MAENIKYTEQELVSLLKKRSQSAYSYLYDNYSGALLTTILGIIPDKELANDILQEVYISVFRKIEQYDEKKSRIYTWMLNIARNQAIDTARSKGYRNNLQNREVTETVYDQAGSVQMNADAIGLKKLLEKLRPEYRDLILLSYFKGYTQEEIAKIQEIPLGTVKTRLRAGLQELRGYIGIVIFVLFVIEIIFNFRTHY